MLNADDAPRAQPDAKPAARRPSPLMAGGRILGDITSPVVHDDDWDALK